jgi:anthranilate synthase/aminodeoxychorismate synthase-like glutamine amidotransferase
MILLLDNYDSFTWNVYQALAALGAEVEVVRNDARSVDELLAREPAGLLLSPGPGRPAQAGVMPELLRRAPERLPLLGVCLGHQALVECYGGELERDPVPVHGKASLVHHEGDPLFEGLPNPFPAGRYHSLRARRSQLPACLELTAWTAEGHVMAVRHRELPRFGVQFHPESILTPQGSRILARFLRSCGEPAAERR